MNISYNESADATSIKEIWNRADAAKLVRMILSTSSQVKSFFSSKLLLYPLVDSFKALLNLFI